MNGIIESQRGEINRALAGEEKHRRDQQVHHEHLLEQNRDLREDHEKSQRNGRIEEISKYYCKTKTSRGSGYYSGAYW